MSQKTKQVLCVIVSRIFAYTGGVLLFLLLIGFLSARHVDSPHEVLDKCWMFIKLFGICCIGALGWGMLSEHFEA